MTFDMWAVQPWNTMLLPTDQRGSFVLDLPEHPGFYPEGMMEKCEDLLDELFEPLKFIVRDAKMEQRLDWETIEEFDKAKQSMTPHIIKLSHFMGSTCLSEEAYFRHREVFGKALGWDQ